MLIKQEVVTRYHWLLMDEFAVGLGLDSGAERRPGLGDLRDGHFHFRHAGNPEVMNFIVRIVKYHRIPLMG